MRTPRLRTILAAVVAGLTLITCGLALALVALTTRLHDANRELAAAVESVRLTHQAAIELLVHARANDPVVRSDLASDLLRRFDEARVHVTTRAEAVVLEQARSAVDGYLDSAPERRYGDAYAALARLVEVNVAQARQSTRRAARLDGAANRLGIAAATGTALVSFALLWWLYARAFQPMLALARAMARYGAGEKDARADERGPAEVRAMARQFNGMASTLTAQREARLAFLGGIAHDLRNPVAVLRMTVDGLAEPAPTDARIERSIHMMTRGLDRIERMLGDFLDSSSIEAGTLRLEPRPCDVVEIVRHVAAAAQRSTAVHRVRVEAPDEEVAAWCDPLRIEQVLANLVSNAVKYSPGGGTVTATVMRSSDTVSIEVRDEGVGLSENDRARIGAPFQRVGDTRIPGVGLGLFVARSIVEAHGGRLEIESAPGRGATFRVHLRASGSAGRAARPDLVSALGARGRTRTGTPFGTGT